MAPRAGPVRGSEREPMPRRAGPCRTCLGCRTVRRKVLLVRFVRGRDGRARRDPGGTAPGRGAYACPERACLVRALTGARLSHAFRRPTEPPAESPEALLGERGAALAAAGPGPEG
jgi:hypothetical protein